MYRTESEIDRSVCTESYQQIDIRKEIQIEAEVEDYDYFEEEFDP